MSKNVELDEEILHKINDLLNKDEGERSPNSPIVVSTGTHSHRTNAAATPDPKKPPRKKFEFYDLERTECVQDEEVLFINGTQIKLTLPEERELINNCLATGRVEDYGLLKRILENSGLAILPDVRSTTAITTNLNVKQMNVVEESISIKRINAKSGHVVEVNDRHVNTTANESFVEHVNVLRRTDDDDDETDDIRMRIFQNIIEEDSGIQDEHLDYLDRFPGLRNGFNAFPKCNDLPHCPPHGYSNNSLDGFYSTDLSTSSSASNLGQRMQNATMDNIPGVVGTSEPKPNSLFYRDGVLISGDLDTLVQHLMPTESYEPCSNYLFTFLLCGRLFIPPPMLLRRILEDAGAVGADRNKTLAVLLTHWVQKCPYDFLSPQLMQVLEKECLVSIQGSLRESILRELRMRLERVRLYQNYLSLLRQIIVSNEKWMHVGESSASTSSTGDKDDEAGHQIDRSSGGSSLGGSNDQNGDSFAESPFVNMEEAIADTQDRLYEDFHLNSLYANNSNRKNLQRIGELKVTVKNYQFSLCDMSSASQVAHQLTHIEVERLSFIGPSEFVQAFVKQQHETSNSTGGCDELIKGMHIRTPSTASARRESGHEEGVQRKLTQNLENYVQWFNRLTYLVASDIVKKNVKKKIRAKMIDFWIEVAHECFNIGNFNSLMAITTALNLSSISRLKKTWSKVQLRAKFSILEHQMDPSSNFCSYRSTLKAAMWRSAGATQVDNDRSRIIIPFFSLLVKDLLFLNEGCMSKLPNGHVNFEKLWLLSQHIREFMEWQKVHVPFEKNPSIIFYLETRPILETENQIALASFECETPDNGADKDRFKSLKRN